MLYTEFLAIDKKDIDLINSLLDKEAEEDGVEKAGYPTDSSLITFTAFFDNGYFADIKLCSGQTNFFGDNILYDKEGYEVCVPDCFDSIADGDVFTFENGHDVYQVTILEKIPFCCDRTVREAIKKYFIQPYKKLGGKMTVGFSIRYNDGMPMVYLYTDKPGICIGKRGETLEKFKTALNVKVYITEVSEIVY